MVLATGATFVVKGVPVAQPRTNATVIGGPRGSHARVYTPKTADGWKASVAHEAGLAFADGPMPGPAYVSLEFYFARPKSHWTKNGNLTKSAPRVWHTQRPDADNLAKAVLDALKGIAFVDDVSVAVLRVSKLWADWQGQSSCRITVTSPDPASR